MRRLKENELNVLDVKNLNEFLDAHQNNTYSYKPKFKILSELESRVNKSNTPEPCIFIEYKDGGYFIFDLSRIYMDSHRRIVVYAFNGIAS